MAVLLRNVCSCAWREDKLILGEGLEPSMSDLAERSGLLHTVDWPEPSHDSKTHRELHSMLVAFANSGNHRTCSTVREAAGLFLFDHH